MNCRVGCAACCVVISISSPIPGMPGGKAAGTRCLQLTEAGACRLFGLPERPAICNHLQPSLEMCGTTNPHAYTYLARLEELTRPVALV
jgi:hypothetical protein